MNVACRNCRTPEQVISLQSLIFLIFIFSAIYVLLYYIFRCIFPMENPILTCIMSKKGKFFYFFLDNFLEYIRRNKKILFVFLLCSDKEQRKFCTFGFAAQNKALRITIPEIIADAVVQIMDEHLQPIYATQTTIAVPVRILGCLHCFMPFCTHNQSLGPVCTMNGEPFPNTFLVREA